MPTNTTPLPTAPAADTHEAEIQLPHPEATVDDHRNPRRNGGRASSTSRRDPESGTLVMPEDCKPFEDVVLYPEVTTDIEAALHAIAMRDEMERIWNISKIQPQTGRCILDFYGEPGTGKTMAARAIAKRLGKPLLQVDYSQIISKYLGDTAKAIVKMFATAKEWDAILFLDEADSLMSRRLAMGESCATSINQNRNVLMQELDRFNGVVIVTTNLFGNYDPAMLRRIARHIKFKLPNRDMRKRLFSYHLPNLERVSADLDIVASSAKGLSGGDILNVCLNSIYAGSVAANSADWKVTGAMLLAEVEKIKNSKLEHGENHQG